MLERDQLVDAYDFELPQELIAQEALAQRDAARLMVVRHDEFQDRRFSELPDILRPDDILVLNETRVIPARLFANRVTGGKVEVLLLHPAGGAYNLLARRWTALLRPAKRIRIGETLTFVGASDNVSLGKATLVAANDDGTRDVHLELDVPLEEFLQRDGRLPLPPYVRNDSQEAQESYQTIFARVPGSVAAPTAALHFTQELFTALKTRGIETAKLTLDVGLGTFRPMASRLVDQHLMHSERYALSREAVVRIERAKAAGRRVVAVGTTVVRALEGNVAERGHLLAGEWTTSIFIKPGFRFRIVDAMITNFHLPRSTLLVLVSAFSGRERILDAYRAAIQRGYRFFSFGDAMFLTQRGV